MVSFRGGSRRRGFGNAALAVVLAALVTGVAGPMAAQAPPGEGGTATANPTPGPTAVPVGAVARPAATYPLAEMLPDNELVYGYTRQTFDTAAFVAEQGGYLARYNEVVDGEVLSGAAVVQQVAEDFSVNPALLLALIQAYGRWVTDPNPPERSFPVGEPLPGLFAGLSAAADGLNRLYYGHRHDDLRVFPVANGRQVALERTNAATFALVGYLSRNVPLAEWAGLREPSRVSLAYARLFGDPAAKTPPGEPNPPPAMSLALPFQPGEVWYYVLGPHSPWGVGGPRAAVDFAPPPASVSGCAPSPAWVTAVADGVVLRSRTSGVVVDVAAPGFPPDDFEGSGWVHVYTHLSPLERVAAGTRVRAGDRLGHPSCDGSLVPEARLAFSRRFNGEWVPVDEARAPLSLGDWTALPGPEPGSGWLVHRTLPPRLAGPEKQDARNGVAAVPGGQ